MAVASISVGRGGVTLHFDAVAYPAAPCSLALLQAPLLVSHVIRVPGRRRQLCRTAAPLGAANRHMP